ncbi:MAG: hypothetical protein KAJ75_05420 [Alphaproteobacteria bacterium]|nr:hypothetical protein [Alphaproteobacteria bacterium]
MTVDDLMGLLESCHYKANVRFVITDETLHETFFEGVIKTGAEDELNPGTVWLLISPPRRN